MKRATSNEYLALHDTMTGLMNRAGLLDRLDLGHAQAKRSGKQLALLFMDLNRFKNVNDIAGHAVGDEILIMVSSRLKSLFRATDTVARWGGDEFLVIIPDLMDTPDVEKISYNIINAIEAPYQVGGNKYDLGVSIGISMHSKESQDMDTLISLADKAMYRAKVESKRLGRSAFCFAEAQK